MKILVPLDASTTAEAALPLAAKLAHRFGGSLVLTTVLELPSFVSDANLPQQQQQWLETYLDDRRCEVEAHVPCRVRLEKGQSASTLIRLAQEEEVDLIVLTSHGRSGPGRWLMGSVSDKLMRGAPCPVLIMRAPWASLERVLVPLDGTPQAEASLAPAAALARGGKLTLIRVQDFHPQSYPGPAPMLGESALIEHSEANAKDYLSHCSVRLSSPNYQLETLLRHGSAASEILDAASQDTDLIVLASQVKSWAERAFFGSVAERVIHHAPCPVLLIRGKELHLS